MKIVFLVHDIHLGGGGERVTVNLANALVAKGIEVAIVSMSTPSQSKSTFTLDRSVELHYLKVNHRINLLDKVGTLIAMNKFLRGRKVDFVLGIGNYPSLILSLVFTNRNIRKIGCMHLSFGAIPFFWRMMARIFFRRLDMLVSLTHHDVSILQRLNPNVTVIPNSTSFRTQKHASLDHKVALALGRFDDEKDFETMIQLFGTFCKTRNDWTLRIRGAGPLQNRLENLVKTMGLEANIQILPPTKEVELEYLTSSVLLLTSKYEGLPMVLIEAQTFGVPVISFDCKTGPAEIVQDGKSGYLINLLKKEDFVTRLIELTSNETLRKQMGQNAIENATRFSETAIINQWMQLFESLSKH